MKACDFVGMLFLARDVAHRVHLSTRSYAKHMALDGFYHEIIELADKFTEAYQGQYGLLSIPLMSSKKSVDIVTFLNDQKEEIEACRYEICDKKDAPLQNIIDEIVGQYLSTLYKLKFLA